MSTKMHAYAAIQGIVTSIEENNLPTNIDIDIKLPLQRRFGWEVRAKQRFHLQIYNYLLPIKSSIFSKGRANVKQIIRFR